MRSRTITAGLMFCVLAQHAFLADILPRRPGGTEARPGAGVFIAGPTAPSAIKGHPGHPTHPGPSPSLPPRQMLSARRVPSAERTRPVTISEAVLSVQTWVLRSRVPSSGFRIFNFGGKGWLRLRVQTFLQDLQHKSKELLIWGRAGEEEGTGSVLFFVFVFFF